MRIAVTAAAVCLSIVGLSVAEDAGAAMKKQFTNIPAQGLGPALQTLAQQREFQVVYLSDSVDSLRTVGAVGEMTSNEALTQLLSGTGLTFRYLEDNTVTIFPSTSSASAGGDRAPGTGEGGTAQRGVRVAQNEPSQNSQRSQNSETSNSSAESQNSKNHPSSPAKAGEENESFEEVVVTGTHIRGSRATGSNLIVIDREQIAASGRSTMPDLLQTVPQNFAPNVTEFQGGGGNFTRQSAINLRGLGEGTTLTLLNGRRLPAGGDNGDFVDISRIPIAAVERVEILTDGASAIYGSDAIGGVVNFILRDDYEGAETTARVGTAEGDATETVLSQTFGHGWQDGNIMLSYQYYRRESLFAQDRSFAASADKRPLGGSDFRNALSNPGTILSPFDFSVAYSIPRGQDGRSLTVADLIPGQVNYGGDLAGSALTPENEINSVFLAAHHALTETVALFAEGLFSRRSFRFDTPPTAFELFVGPDNPFYIDPFGFGGPVIVGYSFEDDFGPDVQRGDSEMWSASGGARFELPRSWNLTVSGSYGVDENHGSIELFDFFGLLAALDSPDEITAFNPFGDGSHTNAALLNALRGFQINDTRSTLWSANAIAEGVVFQLPAGTARFAIGADYRVETLDSSRAAPTLEDLERNVTALFGELAMPIVAGPNGRERPLLEASLAGRYEEYSDFGTTFNPRVSVRFSPLTHLSLRGSWGTSFRAPNLIDLDTRVSGGAQNVSLQNLPDPVTFTRVLLHSGNNPLLNEETAKAWTAGLELSEVLPGFEFSASYFSIDYEDRIVTPGPVPVFFILQEEEFWSDVINRAPTQAQLTELCSQLVTGSCALTPPAAIVDIRKRNLSALSTRGIDFDVRQKFAFGGDRLQLSLGGTYISEYSRKFTPGSSTFDVVDTLGNPLGFRLRGSANLAHGNYAANVGVNFQDAFRVNAAPGAREIDSWTTVDASLAYTVETSKAFLDGVQLALRVVNLFDEDPPFHDSNLGYDVFTATPMGRTTSVEIRKSW